MLVCMGTRAPEPVATREAKRPLRVADGRDRRPIASGEITSELNDLERGFANDLPVEKIPALVWLLVERLRSRSATPSHHTAEPERLLTAGEMAERLSVPESWIRTEERASRVPSIRLGRYVRFRASEVEAALQARGHAPQ